MAVDELQRVSRAKGLTRVKALVAPLLVFSVGLHGLLLLIPLLPRRSRKSLPQKKSSSIC